MIIGSHNSWSYLRPKKWWMRLLAFTARCQHYVLWAQYKEGARCFDLHVRFTEKREVEVVHGPIVYDIESEVPGGCIYDYLKMLDDSRDVSVRVILDVRTRKARKHYGFQCECFKDFCKDLEMLYPHITFWCGRMVKGWHPVYYFNYDPSCKEDYASVSSIGIWPWLYARLFNLRILKKGTDEDILLLDFVDINGRWRCTKQRKKR